VIPKKGIGINMSKRAMNERIKRSLLGEAGRFIEPISYWLFFFAALGVLIFLGQGNEQANARPKRKG